MKDHKRSFSEITGSKMGIGENPAVLLLKINVAKK